MSTLEVNSIDKESGSTLTLGGSGTQVTVHASATTSGFPEAGLASVQTFTSSGTWNRPAGITKVIMEVQGGGGGGASDTTSSYAHTGAGGGYAKKFLDVSSISTATITVGAGGAGIATGGSPNAGGASSWADGTNTITGNGGTGGSPNSSASTNRSAVGGTGVGGDINVQGGPSGSGFYDTGNYGNSFMGTGGVGWTSVAASTAVKDGAGYGSGGGGNPYSGQTSGSGADGIVIVWEYK